MIVDAHTHAWGPPSEDHPSVNDVIVDLVADFAVDGVYTAEKLLADIDREAVDEAVVVGYPICDWTDNWYTLEAASEFDRLHGVVMLDHVAWLLDRFGRERVIWGSDYPNVSDEATYAEAVHWLDHVDVLSDRDLEWIRGRSFRSHVGI